MVYCGKPSKGCCPCREKRTKCDLTRPKCGQCRRAGRQCGGYRDEASLMFRDQSNNTAAKFHVVEAKAPRETYLPRSTSQIEEVSEVLTNSSSSSLELALTRSGTDTIVSSLEVPLEHQAVSYFFSNYIHNKSDYHRGFLDYLPGVFTRNSPESTVAQIITSLGMSGLANVRKVPEAKAISTSKYAAALRGVNTSLRDPARATEDETLITVLLLGIYEINNGVAVQSVKTWIEHINGAMALISLRGEKQLESDVGRRLFYHLRSQILIGCLHRRVPVPDNVIKWSKLAGTCHDGSYQESRLFEIFCRFNNWRANELSSFTDYRDPLRNVKNALGFENELTEWLFLFQLQYPFTTMPVQSNNEDVFSDYYYVYPDIYTALIWQNLRCVRILINEIIVTQIAALYYQQRLGQSPSSQPEVNSSTSKDVSFPPDFEFANNFYAAHAVLTSLTHDICAAVPSYLNYHIYGSDWANPDHPPPTVNGNLLLWPLFLVGQLEAVSPMMRKWAVGRMIKISEVMGVQQVGTLGKIIGDRHQLTVLDRPDEV